MINSEEIQMFILIWTHLEVSLVATLRYTFLMYQFNFLKKPWLMLKCCVLKWWNLQKDQSSGPRWVSGGSQRMHLWNLGDLQRWSGGLRRVKGGNREEENWHRLYDSTKIPQRITFFYTTNVHQRRKGKKRKEKKRMLLLVCQLELSFNFSSGNIGRAAK